MKGLLTWLICVSRRWRSVGGRERPRLSDGMTRHRGGWPGSSFVDPSPLRWLGRACGLPGKALATALAVWFVAGLRNRREGLPLTAAVMNRFRVSRYAKSRALRALEAAGLIRVERRSRRNPLVTIVDGEQPGRPAHVEQSPAEGPVSRKLGG
jgi:hypothetical protein